jgi:hypothetical protein
MERAGPLKVTEKWKHPSQSPKNFPQRSSPRTMKQWRHGLKLGYAGLAITVVGVIMLYWTPWVLIVGFLIGFVGFVSASWHR